MGGFTSVGAGPLLDAVTAFLSRQIRRAQQEGASAPRNPEAAAEIIARLGHSLLLTPGGGIDAEDDAELRAWARSYLLPIIWNMPR